MTRLLITGVSGLLGINLALTALKRHPKGDPYEITGLVHSHPLNKVPFQVYSTDLNNFDPISDFLDDLQPEILINCAAVTNLDAVEADPEPAKHLNAEFPGFLAAYCSRKRIRFLHLSTDAVFDGIRGDYSEGDPVSPQNEYARSKAAAEQAIQAVNPEAIIARVNFYGWSLTGQRGLAEWFFNHLSAKNPIKGFTDIFFCPLFANDLSDILLKMVEKPLTGLYHVVSSESMSKYEFGRAIAGLFGFDEDLIQPVSYQEAGLLAQRSPKMTLRTQKLAGALGIALPDIHSGLEKFHDLFLAGYPQKLHSFLPK